MTNPKLTAEQLLENFRHDFNHIADGRILVEPKELADYIRAALKEAVEAIVGPDDYAGIRNGPVAQYPPMDEADKRWYEGRKQLRAEQRARAKTFIGGVNAN